MFCKNWMAFTYLHKPPFSEHSSIYFVNDRPPEAQHNNAYCKVSTHVLKANILKPRITVPHPCGAPSFQLLLRTVHPNTEVFLHSL